MKRSTLITAAWLIAAAMNAVAAVLHAATGRWLMAALFAALAMATVGVAQITRDRPHRPPKEPGAADPER